jgi:thiamine biosynthesis protein ThiS
MPMRLLINGEERAFTELRDVAALVAALGLDARKVAVERNLEIVPRSTYAAARLHDGDRIEIVHFVGGG